MLTWGFEAEAERLFNKAVERRHRMQRAQAEGRTMSDSESSGEDELDEDDEEAEWRGYEEVVVGSGSDSDDDGNSVQAVRVRVEREAQRMAAELFRACDVDGSGELSVDEVATHLTEVLLRDKRRWSGQRAAAMDSVGQVDDSVDTADVALGGVAISGEGVIVERLGPCLLPLAIRVFADVPDVGFSLLACRSLGGSSDGTVHGDWSARGSFAARTRVRWGELPVPVNDIISTIIFILPFSLRRKKRRC